MPGNLILAFSHSLYSLHENRSSISLISGPGSDHYYHSISDFAQSTDNKIIIVDTKASCLLQLNRQNKELKTFAGKCDSPGDRVGLAESSRFLRPRLLVRYGNINAYYVSDSDLRSIREIRRSPFMWTVRELANMAPLEPFSISLDFSQHNLLVVTRDRTFVSVNGTSGSQDILFSVQKGESDGIWEAAEAYIITSIIAITDTIYLMADPGNGNLRVLDTG